MERGDIIMSPFHWCIRVGVCGRIREKGGAGPGRGWGAQGKGAEMGWWRVAQDKREMLGIEMSILWRTTQLGRFKGWVGLSCSGHTSNSMEKFSLVLTPHAPQKRLSTDQIEPRSQDILAPWNTFSSRVW